MAKSKKNNSRLVVVLGMHRSGTSAITKSLELLGVGLGDDLHPAGFDNPKGFWEDRECIEINNKLLMHLGSAYDRLGIAWDEIQLPQISELRLIATQLISRKLIENKGIWGFKDPRTCRLLGFWKEVFLASACQVYFVIAVRNPASVAASLAVRNNIPAEKAYFLWLQHVLPPLSFMKDAPRVVVDYDEFLTNPWPQIIRITGKLGLPLPDRHSTLVKEFENDFLQSELRHARFTEAELALDKRASTIVKTTYGLLHRLATDQESLDNPIVQTTLCEINEHLSAASPVFDYTNDLEDERSTLWQAATERDGQIASLNQAVAERDGQIASLNQAATERDGQIASLNQAVAERDGQIASLNRAVAERDWQLGSLSQTVAERDAQFAAQRVEAELLRQAVVNRDGQIASLNQAVAERDGQVVNISQAVSGRDRQIASLVLTVTERAEQIANLNHAVAQRDGQIAGLVAEREHIFSSTSWKITKPLRFFRRSVVNKPCCLTRKVISDGVRHIWRKLPLSTQRKSFFKYWLFSNLPFLFRWSRAYRSWATMNSPSDQVTASITNQSISFACEQVSGTYVPLLQVLPPKDIPVRLIAFYLPQFHAIAENNTWWGEEFTEWTNVKPAQPQFEGHYQPHVPGELGYYNLLDPAVQRRQVELAKLYGLEGFCFYFYWFGGKRLLETPIENYLNDKSLDLPFCLCWANENWSRRWDGLDSEILVAQNHSPEDDLAFIQHVSRYMKDERYICIDGKPLLLVYRPNLLPSTKETAKRWREWCLQNGIGEIYLAYTQSFETVDPTKYGFDAAIEFPPNNSSPPNITETVRLINDRFSGTVYDWRVFVERSRNYQKPAYKLFRSVCPFWDNTARRKDKGTVFLNSTPQGYQEWLKNAVAETCARIANPNERLIFVNAWNEWAEGAHLEPDQVYGYSYLEATRRALTGETGVIKNKKIVVVSHDAHPHGAQFLALGMVRSLKQDIHLEVEVVLLGKGLLTSDFAAIAPVHDLSDADPDNAAITHLANSLAQRGFTRAIVNTTVSGGVVPAFYEAGIESVCLVHELSGVIQSHHLENHAKQIAAFAKAVVFPAKVVADGFSKFASVAQENQFIRPQGLYRRNKWRLERGLARARLREQLGLNVDTKIVLTVGYADHRKGVDLFVDCALKILAKRSDIDFIWVGHWEQVMQKEIETKLLKSPYKNRIHFVGFNPETALFHAGADVYALPSREDPFPNVVLESFDAGVPVVAFAGTGGASHLVEDVGGLVVPSLDVAEFSDAICRLLDSTELSVCLGEAAQNHVDEHFAFRPYLFELCGILGIDLPKVTVIVPNYNYAQHIEGRLSSIRNQSIPIFELIILDDASTDQSLQKISHWLSSTHTDARVVVNLKNSANVFAQWRRGIYLATGDYVWIAEADDLSEPDFLETVLPPLVSNDAVLSYCESQQINPEGIVQATNYRDYLSAVSLEKWRDAYLESGVEECKSFLAVINTIPNVSAVVFKRSVIDVVFRKHFDDIARFKKAGDWVSYIYILSHGNIAFSPRTANHHRRHGGSVVGGSGWQCLLQEITEVQQLVASNYPITKDVSLLAADYLSSVHRQFAL